MFSRRRVIAAAAATSCLLPAGRSFAASPLTAKELLIRPAVRDVSLTPDGQRIAVLHRGFEAGKAITYVLIHATKTPDAPPTMIHLGNHDVERVRWGNDDRLLIWTIVHVGPDGAEIGIRYRGEIIPTPSRRVLAIDPDGGNSVILFGNQPDLLKTNYDLGDLTDVLLDDPRHVLMQAWDGAHRRTVLQRVDIYTGEGVEVERGVYDTFAWITQNGVPVLRYDVGAWRTVNVFARVPGEKAWKFFRKYRRNDFEKLDDFEIVGSTDDAGVILVATQPAGEDFQLVQRLDLRALAFGEVFAKRPETDLTGLWSDRRRIPLATTFLDDKLGYGFLDRSFEEHYRRIKAAFDDSCNIALGECSLDRRHIILSVSGPRTPLEYWSYDVDRRALRTLGKTKPWLGKDRLASMEALKIRARDGAVIPAYLTVPALPANGPRPLVVMPHGGPELRDKLDFDLFVQALAAQGWLVLQPNFRGSSGYGRVFADAGRKRWGDRMQEDVEDCVADLIRSKRADPARVAICGASYGGYAALMGAVRRPELYKSVVSIAGPSDLLEFLEASRRDSGADSPTYAYWLRTIGDPKADRTALEAASPARRVAEIKAPVLLVHGTADDIVPLKQSQIMKAALEKAGRPPDYVELKRKGHSGWDEATWLAVIERATAHIAKAFA